MGKARFDQVIETMKPNETISKTIAFVKKTLSDAEGGHDWFHTQRVYKNAQTIAQHEDVDPLVVALGALLHDIADSKFSTKNSNLPN